MLKEISQNYIDFTVLCVWLQSKFLPFKYLIYLLHAQLSLILLLNS